MRIDDQFVAMANDYISGNLKPEDLRGFIEENVDESLELDKSGDPKALLFGFIRCISPTARMVITTWVSDACRC